MRLSLWALTEGEGGSVVAGWPPRTGPELAEEETPRNDPAKRVSPSVSAQRAVLRRALRHLHRMADPGAFMFDQPLSVLSDLGVMPGTAASGLAAPRSLSALTEGAKGSGVGNCPEATPADEQEESGGLAPSVSALTEEVTYMASTAPAGRKRGENPRASSVSAFSSPPPYGAMPAWHEDALNNQRRRLP